MLVVHGNTSLYFKHMSNETIYLKGPFGTGIRYKGRTPFLGMLKLGSACLILGVAGISLYKYKKKIDIDEEIRKDKAVTQNKIDFDNVHTENNRQKKKCGNIRNWTDRKTEKNN